MAIGNDRIVIQTDKTIQEEGRETCATHNGFVYVLKHAEVLNDLQTVRMMQPTQ